MKRNIMIITLLCTLPLTTSAAEVLYQCVKDGEVIMQDSKPKDCDTIKKYYYESYNSEIEEPEGLRSSEQKILRKMRPTQLN